MAFWPLQSRKTLRNSAIACIFVSQATVGGRGVFQGSRKMLHTVEDTIIRRDGWLGEILVAEFDCVRNFLRFCGFCHHPLVPVVLC